jgi:hypothetical protein
MPDFDPIGFKLLGGEFVSNGCQCEFVDQDSLPLKHPDHKRGRWVSSGCPLHKGMETRMGMERQEAMR